MQYDWSPYAPQPWRSRVTPYVLPILIERAKAGQPISYTELAIEIAKRQGAPPQPRKTLYGQPVGAVGFALRDLAQQWGEDIPAINVIVVSEATKMPGNGVDMFLTKLAKGATKEERKAIVKLAMEDVFSYPHAKWDRVAAAFGYGALRPAKSKKPVSIVLPKVPTFRGASESSEHKALKAKACATPERFKMWGNFKKGTPERLLKSGDEVDACFESNILWLAVEVKASHASNAELVRGVFQCVKYREVLRAEQIALGIPPNAQAILLTTRILDQNTKNLLQLLRLKAVEVPIAWEK